jgi:macrolide-specific efflux system membrane fusion protein
MLVSEGDLVTRGQILAWLSSTDRAALLDAATARGEEEVAHWQDVYKPTPLIAPIDGQVIVRGVEPGQTVNAAMPVIVISDRLIVRGFVDETDIGQVCTGQTAEVTLDAYPAVRANGLVDHISYEARVINNVVVYEVEIVPDEVPDVFRSGMSAAIAIVDERRTDVRCLPLDAVEYDEEGAFVHVADATTEEGLVRRVTVGLTDDENVEIVDGVEVGDALVIRRTVFALSEEKTAKNPFMPSRRGNRRR